jgi:eukaryotic-like serine/threonine-protein kinase
VASVPAPDLQTLRPGLPPALAALVARLLAKRPGARPADAQAAADELRALRGSL